MILTLTSITGLEDNQAGKLVRRITPRMWGPKIAKLMNIPPITMVYGTQITILTGVFKPTFTSRLGGPHCICFVRFVVVGDPLSTCFFVEVNRGFEAAEAHLHQVVFHLGFCFIH